MATRGSEALTLKVTVDQKEAERLLKQFGMTVQQQAAKGVAANTKLAASFEAVRIQVARLRNIMLLWSFTIGSTIFILDKFFTKARDIQGVAAGFEALGRRISATPKFLDKLREASQGLVSDQDLMKQANNAIILGVAKTEDQFADLVQTASTLGQALGVDAVRALESMTVGIGRQSRLMLDNLGIIVSVDEANRKYAKTLGITVEEMSDAQRKQAFLNETIFKANSAVDSLAPRLDTLATSWAELKVRIENATDAFIAYINTRNDLKGLENVTPQGVIVGTQGATIQQFRLLQDELGKTRLLDEQLAVNATEKIFSSLFDEPIPQHLARKAQDAIFKALILSNESLLALQGPLHSFDEVLAMVEHRLDYGIARPGDQAVAVLDDMAESILNVVESSRKLTQMQDDQATLQAALAKAGVEIIRDAEGVITSVIDKGGNRSDLQELLRQERYGGTGTETRAEVRTREREEAQELLRITEDPFGPLSEQTKEFKAGTKEFKEAVDKLVGEPIPTPQSQGQFQIPLDIDAIGGDKERAEERLKTLGLPTPDEVQAMANIVSAALRDIGDLDLRPDQAEILRVQLEEIGRDLMDQGGVVHGIRELQKEVITTDEAMRIWAEEGLTGLREHLEESNEEIQNLADNMKQILRTEGIDAAQELGATLVDAAFDGSDAWDDFFKDLLRNLAKAIVQALIFRAIMAAANGGGATLPISNEGLAAGLLGGGGLFAKGGIVGAQRGALLRGGTPGRDSILIAAQRREMVLPPFISDFLLTVGREFQRRGQQAGQSQPEGRTERPINLTINAGAGVDAQSLRDFFERDPAALVSGIRNAVRRGEF